MSYEPFWNRIFLTIAHCYHTLSSCEETGEKVWKQDIAKGIDVLISHNANKELFDQLAEMWKNDPNFNSYINSLQTQAQQTDDSGPKEPDTLLAIIFEHHQIEVTLTGAKAILDQVVPVPGPPCLLQVVIQSFNNRLSSYLIDKLQVSDKKLNHLFFLCGYLRVMKLTTRDGTMSAEMMKALASMLLVAKDGKISFSRVDIFRTKMHQFFKEILKMDPDKREQEFYSPFNNAYGAFGKTLFSVMNLTLTMQAIYGLELVIENDPDPKVRETTRAQLHELQVSAAMGCASVAMNSLRTAVATFETTAKNKVFQMRHRHDG